MEGVSLLTVSELIQALPLTVAAGQSGIDRKIASGYVSDLLSNVMGFAGSDCIWVTMQGHQNVIAVASLANLSAVVIAGGALPDEDTVRKADAEGIVLLTTPMPAFELIGRMHEMGIRGS